MSRRRGKSSTITTIYWRDIPAQITATAGGVTEKALLEPRFQHAIDRAAAVANLTETEAYVAQWRKVATPLTGEDARHAADGAAAKITSDYPRDRLEQLVAQGGAELTDTAGADPSDADNGDGTPDHSADDTASHQNGTQP